MARTPEPWKIGEFDEYLGYDCMTGGIRSGPVKLDGSDYGQEQCEEIDPEAKARMLADAHLIAAAPELLAALQQIAEIPCDHGAQGFCPRTLAREAIAKAEGKVTP